MFAVRLTKDFCMCGLSSSKESACCLPVLYGGRAVFVSVALPILVRSIEHLVPRPYFPFHPLSNLFSVREYEGVRSHGTVVTDS